MSTLPVTFDVPHDIIGGLATGDLIRRGGVIQTTNGTVRMWLREVGIEPQPSSSFCQSIGEVASRYLGFVGSVASILNLGATVAYGSKICNELADLKAATVENSRKLDDIRNAIGKVQWTLDVGFLHLSQQLDGVKNFWELDLAAQADSVGNLAWSAQMFPPDSQDRKIELGHARAQSSLLVSRLLGLLKRDCEKLSEALSVSDVKQSLGLSSEVVEVVDRARYVCIVLSLDSMIRAESGQPDAAGKMLSKQVNELSSKVTDVCRRFLEGGKEYNVAAGLSLISKVPKEKLPLRRVARWYEAFQLSSKNDPYKWLEPIRNHFDPPQVILATEDRLSDRIHEDFFGQYVDRHQREKDTRAERDRYVDSRVFPVDSDRAIRLADAMDGYIEDIDRLQGTAAELQVCESMKISWHEYCERLKVDELPAGKRLALFSATATTPILSLT